MIFFKSSSKSHIQRLWKKSISFHGKPCSGLALGVRVCDTALATLKLNEPENDRLGYDP